MTLSLKILIIVFFSLANYAQAAKPTSIRYVEDIITDKNEIFSYYIVRCSNGREVDISVWDGRKSWCAGKGTKIDCNKKQIKTAKEVCHRN